MDQEPTSVLVVAHQTAATPALLEAVRERARTGPSRFHLLVPRRRRGGDRGTNPQEIGEEEAREVLRDALPLLSEAAGTEVTGDIGDLEPLTAIQDALKRGHYDEIILSTLDARFRVNAIVSDRPPSIAEGVCWSPPGQPGSKVPLRASDGAKQNSDRGLSAPAVVPRVLGRRTEP